MNYVRLQFDNGNVKIDTWQALPEGETITIAPGIAAVITRCYAVYHDHTWFYQSEGILTEAKPASVGGLQSTDVSS